MKRTSIFAVLVFVSLCAFTQNKPQELYDLVTSLTIPQSESINVLPWKNLQTQNAAIVWKEKVPAKSGPIMQQTGVALALIDGKKYICEDEIGGKKGDCKWTISVQGADKAYDRIELSTSNFPVNEAGSEIRMLFPKNSSSFKLLSRCVEGASYWRMLYEVNIPGRKTFWMISTYESMSATASQYESSGVANHFYVGVYLNLQTAEDDCAN